MTDVEGYDRIDPRTGRRVRVRRYRRKGSRHGLFNLDPREWDIAPPVEIPATTKYARLVKKRMSLLPNDQVPTENTPGWTMHQDRRGTPYVGMTDQNYDQWLQHTLKSARTALDRQGSTATRYKTADDGATYTPARKAQQERVIATFMTEAESTPREKKAVFTGGRPGAGKSSSLKAQKITDKRYFTIDPDEVKQAMITDGLAPDIPGLTPLEAAGLIHTESADIADEIQLRLSAKGTNIVVDGTMSKASKSYIQQHAENLHARGYTIKGLFVDVSPKTSLRRAVERHRRGVEKFIAQGNGLGGRWVDPHVNPQDSDNRDTFQALQRYFEAWAMYDNDIDYAEPKLIESSHTEVEFSRSASPHPDTLDVEYYLALARG